MCYVTHSSGARAPDTSIVSNLLLHYCSCVLPVQAPPPSALPPAVLERLVRRVEDYPEQAQRRLQDYKKKLLQTIEVSNTSWDMRSA